MAYISKKNFSIQIEPTENTCSLGLYFGDQPIAFLQVKKNGETMEIHKLEEAKGSEPELLFLRLVKESHNFEGRLPYIELFVQALHWAREIGCRRLNGSEILRETSHSGDPNLEAKKTLLQAIYIFGKSQGILKKDLSINKIPPKIKLTDLNNHFHRHVERHARPKPHERNGHHRGNGKPYRPK